MATVYRGTDVALGRRVAIKILEAARATRAGRDRFAREARAVARIGHPNVLRVYDLGEVGGEGGRPYMVVELVEGRWLAFGTDECVVGQPLTERMQGARVGVRVRASRDSHRPHSQ